MNAIGEHTNSYSKQIESSIINRNSNERIGKEQKSYIIKWYEESKRSISKTAQKLVLGYSTVYSIIKEYDWYKDNDVEPFSINNEKKRISKESEKVIKDFVWNQKEAFTINDISKAVRIETNENIKDYILRQHVKKTLKMTYRKWTNKSWMVDVSKLSILRSLFCFRMGKHITTSTLLISLDETTFNHKIANNKWWIRKGYSAELFNNKFVGSWSLIMAITNEGSYFGKLMKGWINSTIYLEFLKSLETWIETKRRSTSQKVIIFKDNWQVHRARKVWSFIEMSQYMYVYIPMYTPEYSPVENLFGILKSKCKRFRSQRSIYWWKEEGANVIVNEMKSISSWQIVAIWRNFINKINSGLKQILRVFNQ